MVDVVAIGTAVANKSGLSERIERAMVDAIHECYANGITDPDKIRDAKLAAFERVKLAIAAEAG